MAGRKKECLVGREFFNNKGLVYRVIKEIDDRCVVQFLVSGSIKSVERKRVKPGLIRDDVASRKSKYGRRDLIPGNVLTGKYNEDFEIIEGVGNKNCQKFFKIRFLKSGNKIVCGADKILNGCVCDLDAVIEEKTFKKVHGKVFVAISPDGQNYVSDSQNKFAKEHGLDQGNISQCLRNAIIRHKGWRFRYVTDLTKGI